MSNVHEEFDAVRQRQLEIRAELAEMSRAFFSEGIKGDRARKAELDAELTRLDVRRFVLEREKKKAKRLAQIEKSMHLSGLLMERMRELGLGAVVEECNQLSLAHLESVGQMDAYRVSL